MPNLTLNGRPVALSNLQSQVGPGWSNIIERLVEDLFKLGWDGHVTQVKEKFGALRFYIEKGSDSIYARIDQAGHESERACEECGAPGKGRDRNSWLKTLCDECAAKELDA